MTTGRGAVLDHRIAARERYDDELAGDLEAYALEQHRLRAYRVAAYYWRAASLP